MTSQMGSLTEFKTVQDENINPVKPDIWKDSQKNQNSTKGFLVN